MEIVIDAALVRAILTDEAARLRADLGEKPLGTPAAHRALAASQRRHDERLASAPDVGSLDCREGCDWCCHFSVDVRAVEVFGLLDLVEQRWTPEARARLLDTVRANAQALAGLDEFARMTRNLRCPFLADGRCGVYDARPQTCRNYHATDVAGCRRSFEDPDDLDIDPDFAPGVYQRGAAHVEAFAGALRDAGYDVRAYELNAALLAALTDPSARARFDGGGEPFPGCDGEDVPEEFDDL